MKIFKWLLFFMTLTLSVSGQKVTDNLLARLDKVIEDKQTFEQNKKMNIAQLTRRLQSLDASEWKQVFMLYERLHESYLTYNYDSAVFYAQKLRQAANSAGEAGLINSARLKMSETLLASGLFAAVKDSLAGISAFELCDTLKTKYYYLKARLYIDMANYYQKDYFTEKYSKMVMAYLDSAISTVGEKTKEYYSLKGLLHIWQHNFQQAGASLGYLFDHFKPAGRQYAVDASTYAHVFNQLNEPDKELEWLLKAAIRDLELANKEYVALRLVANRLYEQGEIRKASHYLNIAVNDAQQYGALQRVLQISQIQPLVEAARLDLVEKQKSRLKFSVYVISILLLLLSVLLSLSFRQYYRIKKVKDELGLSNKALSSVNQQLREVNLIKEQYIAYFFKTNSDLLDKLDQYRQSIDNKLALKKYDQLGSVITMSDIKRERELLFRDFDTGFLNIFPDFIEKFNALFREDERELAINSKHLSPSLRIFALIRLGVADTEKIAHILNYSVHTINTYKTKIKNKSIVPNEDFEKEILKIQSVE